MLIQIRVMLDEEIWRRTRALAALEGVTAGVLIQRVLVDLTGVKEGSNSGADLVASGAMVEDKDQGVPARDLR